MNELSDGSFFTAFFIIIIIIIICLTISFILFMNFSDKIKNTTNELIDCLDELREDP